MDSFTITVRPNGNKYHHNSARRGMHYVAIARTPSGDRTSYGDSPLAAFNRVLPAAWKASDKPVASEHVHSFETSMKVGEIACRICGAVALARSPRS